jgi:polyphosphate kinase
VQIDLIVRGVCCLVPGVRGLSENIRVRSIVGRYLEHARAFYFENGGEPLIYAGSADWMPRNFFRRIEVIYPIHEPELRNWVAKEMFPIELQDNENARELHANGAYTPVERAEGQPSFSAHTYFMAASAQRATL